MARTLVSGPPPAVTTGVARKVVVVAAVEPLPSWPTASLPVFESQHFTVPSVSAAQPAPVGALSCRLTTPVNGLPVASSRTVVNGRRAETIEPSVN